MITIIIELHQLYLASHARIDEYTCPYINYNISTYSVRFAHTQNHRRLGK